MPICAAEGEDFRDAQIVHDTFEASSIQENGFEEPASPMELVEEATQEALDHMASGEFQADIENVMRSTVRHTLSESTQEAMQQGMSQQAAAQHALRGLHSKLDQQFVEDAAKQEAVKVAKQHARAAAASA